IRVPRLPESVTEAEVGDWHKQPGDRVRRDENLLDLETDKVVLEVPSPSDGVLQEIRKEKGAIVNSEEVLGLIEVSEKKPPPSKPKPASSEEGEEAVDSDQKAAITEHSSPEVAAPGHSEEVEDEQGPPLSPSVRRLIREHQLDPNKISAT